MNVAIPSLSSSIVTGYFTISLDSEGFSRTVPVSFFHLYADNFIAGTFCRTTKVTAGSDMSSMGGDFIVDSTGKLLYAYHCKNQFDRPDIEALVEFLRQQDMK